MRFRKIAVALTFVFMSLAARAHAASPDAIVAAIQTSGIHAPSLEGLTEDQRIETVCLALNLYHEARGSTERDILGVAHVTKNRITQGGNRKGFCDIIWEKGQYSWTIRPLSQMMPKEAKAWNRMVSIATTFVIGAAGADFTGGANTFYAKSLGVPKWTTRGTGRQTIGAHTYVKIPRKGS